MCEALDGFLYFPQPPRTRAEFTDVCIPISGAHLFKSEWEGSAFEMLGITPATAQGRAVDNPRNCMLLLCPFEKWLDDSRIAFVSIKGGDGGKLVVLDKTYLDKKARPVRASYPRFEAPPVSLLVRPTSLTDAALHPPDWRRALEAEGELTVPRDRDPAVGRQDPPGIGWHRAYFYQRQEVGMCCIHCAEARLTTEGLMVSILIAPLQAFQAVLALPRRDCCTHSSHTRQSQAR